MMSVANRSPCYTCGGTNGLSVWNLYYVKVVSVVDLRIFGMMANRVADLLVEKLLTVMEILTMSSVSSVMFN